MGSPYLAFWASLYARICVVTFQRIYQYGNKKQVQYGESIKRLIKSIDFIDLLCYHIKALKRTPYIICIWEEEKCLIFMTMKE